MLTDSAAADRGSILLIDDDWELCNLMKEFFELHGFRLDCAYEGRSGLAMALNGNFDAVILDVMLPVLQGIDVLRQIRRRSAVPIIMLTARTERRDRISGLDGGADDYLPKPFDPEELLARIRAILRRSARTAGSAANESVHVGAMRVDGNARAVWLNGEPLAVTSIEFEIIDFLARSAGRTVSRDELSAMLYQRSSTPYERSLDVHISRIRKKLEASPTVTIQTVRGVGYQIAAHNNETPSAARE
jgi:two-component system response regulator CpxR